MQPYRHLCFQADMDVQVVMWLNCLWESLDFITLLPKIIPSVHEHSRFQENDHIQNFNDDKIYLACGSLKYFHCPGNAFSLWLPLPTFSIQSNMRSCTRFVETSPPWGVQVLSTPRRVVVVGNYIICQIPLWTLASGTAGSMALTGAIVPQQRLMGWPEVTVGPGDPLRQCSVVCPM